MSQNKTRREIALTCIRCPLGCSMRAMLEGENMLSVSGNRCKRGEIYAKMECTNPVRTVTSTVRLTGSHLRALPVRTAGPIPKSKIFDCIRALAGVSVAAPVRIGDVIVQNVCDTGVDIIATRDA
ncbi:MAG: DUF1667 domain-containing protein [Christensenellales bacterium]|jgi:CxxC motif-containing protein